MMRKHLRWIPAAGAAVAAGALIGGAPGWAAGAELARMVEAAKKEGEVHYIDNQNQPKTAAALEQGFRRRYGLPDSFKVTHTLRGTGESVAAVQQEIKAGQHTIDLRYVPAVDQVKSVPVNWAGLNLAEVKRIQSEFRKVFRVD